MRALAARALTQLNDQLGAISGVSIDEETTNLMSYQRAYEAAARVVTTVDALTQAVLQMGAISAVGAVNNMRRKSKFRSRYPEQRLAGPGTATDRLQELSTGRRVNSALGRSDRICRRH